ncbi:MAG: DOMON-like domain-containing protein, partial [Steroidobacteraceae bacterium]
PHTAPRGAFYQSSLGPHPATPCEAVRSIEVRLARAPDGGLDLAYTVDGDLGLVRWPQPASPDRTDGLWRHTCFEAFLAPEPGSAYLELNFSPSGAWACYGFDRYREGMRAIDDVAPAIVLPPNGPADSGGRPWTLRAAVRLQGVARARVALAAVIEESGGRLSYWALSHPPGRPDFHHPDGFALRI